MTEYRQNGGRSNPAPQAMRRWLDSDRPGLVFFTAAFLLGGAGVAYPLLSWIVLMFALAALAIVLSCYGWVGLPGVAKGGLWLAGAFCILLLLQVLPLPARLWAGMPGHELAASVAQAANIDAWRAWSLAPGRTLEAVLAVLPPLAALLLMATASPRRRIVALRLILGFAIFNALLGVTQFGAGADGAPLFYGTTHRGVAVGLFVNRNHTAVFLMIAMLLCVLPGVVRLAGREDGPAVQSLRAVMAAMLALAVLASLSRSGVFLLPVALIGTFLLGRSRKLRVRSLLLAAGGCVIAMTLVAQTAPVRALVQRYASAADDARFDYWGNTWLAVRDALPLGTGLGTFPQVYRTVEPLNQLGPSIVNRAHNDFLEMLLVAGLPGMALIAGAFGLAGYAAVKARSEAKTRFERRMPLAGALGIFLIAGASLVDYPLHGLAMATLAGVLLGLLAKPPAERTVPRATAGGSTSALAIARNFGLLCLALWASAVCWSQHWVRAGRAELAWHVQPLDADAWSALASQRQIAGDAMGASRAARHALALDLLDAAALRAEAAARLQSGDVQGGATLMSMGARLGWRDAFTQLWLVEQAQAAGAFGFAVQRIDALLRTHTLFDQVLPLLPPLLAQEAGRQALAEQLGYNPGWRAAFFNAVARSANLDLADLLALLADLRRSPAPAQPEETALIRAVLGDAGRFADAREVWRASGGRGLLGDPGFERQTSFTVSTGPYVWQAGDLPGLSVHAERADPPLSGRAVAVASSGVASGPALTQTLALAPGRYRMGITVLSRDAQIVQGIGLALGCLDRSGQAIESAEDTQGPRGSPRLHWQAGREGAQIAIAYVFVSPSCAGQRFQIIIPAQDNGPYSLWIDDAVLAKSK